MTFALAPVVAFASAAAQSSVQKDAIAARIDLVARQHMAQVRPASMSIAISRGSETLFERAYGVSDLVSRRPVSVASVYRLGTASKQFTAVLLLRQVERGKLSLSDSIGRYLTNGLRPEMQSIRIEQLLNHTAGLPHAVKLKGRPDEEVSTDTMVAWATRDKLSFKPGKGWDYSGAGYVLLGALVEKLYGKSYGDALRDEIARPLGLTTLTLCADPAKDTLMTTGHDRLNTGRLARGAYLHPSRSLGAASICASASDLAAWTRALHGGRVLSQASYAAMTVPRKGSYGYGFGLEMMPTPWDVPVIGYAGSIDGYSLQIAWFPVESLTVVVMFNNDPLSWFYPDLARAALGQLPRKS